MGNYYVAFRPLAESFADQVVTPPPITKKTIEIGFKHSPDTVCIPFKYNLGNYIEALDRGANVLIQAGGGCRFGYYGEIQEVILRKLGYEFDFIKLSNDFSLTKLARKLQSYNPDASLFSIYHAMLMTYLRMRTLEKIETYVRSNIGFEVKPGSFDITFKMFLRDLAKTKTVLDIRQLEKTYGKKMEQLETNKPEQPIRVVMVGELYVLMEPFSNFFLEKELAKRNIEVHRHCTASSILHDFLDARKLPQYVKKAHPYLTEQIGGHGTQSVAYVLEHAREGFDGAIHIKPFGCMPEVNAMPALYNISKDYQFPIIYFSFDSLTSETGIKTRIEAFHDMLLVKRQKYGTGKN